MRLLDDITNSMDMRLSNSKSWWWTERPGVLQSMGSQRLVLDWGTEQQKQETQTRLDDRVGEKRHKIWD